MDVITDARERRADAHESVARAQITRADRRRRGIDPAGTVYLGLHRAHRDGGLPRRDTTPARVGDGADARYVENSDTRCVIYDADDRARTTTTARRDSATMRASRASSRARARPGRGVVALDVIAAVRRDATMNDALR